MSLRRRLRYQGHRTVQVHLCSIPGGFTTFSQRFRAFWAVVANVVASPSDGASGKGVSRSSIWSLRTSLQSAGYGKLGQTLMMSPRGPCVMVSRRSRRAPSTCASVMNVRRNS
jgi:hypothetical protein